MYFHVPKSLQGSLVPTTNNPGCVSEFPEGYKDFHVSWHWSSCVKCQNQINDMLFYDFYVFIF